MNLCNSSLNEFKIRTVVLINKINVFHHKCALVIKTFSSITKAISFVPYRSLSSILFIIRQNGIIVVMAVDLINRTHTRKR